MYIPAVYAINKVDQITVEELNLLDKMKHYVPSRRTRSGT